MKLKITKTEDPGDGKPKSKKLSFKKDKKLNSNYKVYSGIVDEEGKSEDNPTETDAIKNMAKYMQSNQSDQSDKPSNVYRPMFSHISMVYDKKKKQNNS